jgi:hypothetical protein
MLARLALQLTLITVPIVAVAQKDAAAIFRQCSPSVVTIETEDSVGTGFFVENGKYVVTCAHVIAGSRKITIRDSALRIERVLFADYSSDIAVLLLNKPGSSSLNLRQGNAPPTGSTIFVIGSPLGLLDRSMSNGIVSGLRKAPGANFLQFTDPVSEGSSGSPVLDDNGRVVAMVQATLVVGQSLNFGLAAYDISTAIRKAEKALRDKLSDSETKGRLIILGNLGQAIEEIKIYAKPDVESHVYYTTAQFEYLVVNTTDDPEWLGILLTNGKTGYSKFDGIATLPYRVTAPGTSDLRADFSRYIVTTIGKPYAGGGTDIDKGVDAPGFVWAVYKQLGVSLPKLLKDQAELGEPVTRIEELVPGDRLYFWDPSKGKIGHTAVFQGWFEDGGAYFIHADPGKKRVVRDDLREERWRRVLIRARRSSEFSPHVPAGGRGDRLAHPGPTGHDTQGDALGHAD